MNDSIILVCVRATIPLVSPGAIFTKFCSHCGERVMLAKCGQEFLAEHPEAAIVCGVCHKADQALRVMMLTAVAYSCICRN